MQPLKLGKEFVYVFKFRILRRMRLLDVSGLIQMSIKWFEKVDKKSKIRKSSKLISQQSVFEVETDSKLWRIINQKVICCYPIEFM